MASCKTLSRASNESQINTNSTIRLQKLKGVTLILYQQLALKEAEQPHNDPLEHNDEQPSDQLLETEFHMGKNNKRNSKLSCLKPAGAAEALGAMVDNHGNIVTEQDTMADLLKNHWSQVLHHKPTPRNKTKRWF